MLEKVKEIAARIGMRMAAFVSAVVVLWFVVSGNELNSDIVELIAAAILALISFFPNSVKKLKG